MNRGAHLVVAMVLGGCVGRIPIDHAPCPCDALHECCPNAAQDQCVPKGQLQLCDSPVCPLSSQGEPTLEIALGEPGSSAVYPLPDAGDVQLNYGVQGGFHIFLQLRMTGLDPQQILVTRRVLDGADELDYQSEKLPFACDAGSLVLSLGGLTYICPSVAHQQMYDRPLTLEVTLVDKQGRSIKKTHPIVFHCPNDEHRALCTQSYTVRGCGQ